MKRIVIYNSKTGFTEQYAKWIAEALSCQWKPMKNVSAAEVQGFDQVIFGGWIMGSMIMGLDKLREMTTPAAVFAVGSTPAYEEVIAQITEQNKMGDTPLFYMEGGFRFEKLAFPQKMILKTLKKSIAKKENRDRQGDFMAQALGTSFDHTDREQILPLVEACKL